MRSLSGRYELLGRLGSGGMAEVYLARAIGLDDFEKIVVLKRVLPDRVGDRRYAAMFRDEARVAATLEHPNIVHTHDIGLTDEECFFTMEYLHGEDLKAILAAANKAGEQLPLELALQIAVGCAAGLHHAHEQTDYAGHPLGIVHRDISPANIIVTRQSGVKLIDFGIAKAASDKEHTGVGVLKGKVAYMSPEQCRGENLDRRSDIFALGIVLYEMIAMRRPFQASSVLGTVHKVLGEEPIPPRQHRPECPPELEHVVLKALHKDAGARYQSAFEMQEELELVTRDCQLLSLPGGLGRYLEHLFGPKPHPWTQRAKRPPAVPRWAWKNLDSTLTAPRQDYELRKAPQPLPVTRPEPIHVAANQDTTIRTSPEPSSPVVARVSTTTAPSPAAVPIAAPSAPISLAHSYPAELIDDSSRLGSTASHPQANAWGIRHVLFGGLVGGIIAILGLGLWMQLRSPSSPRTTATAPEDVPASDLDSVRVPDPASISSSIPAAVPASGTEAGDPRSPSTAVDTPRAGDPANGEASAEDPTSTNPDELAASPDSSPRASARAAQLIDRARANLIHSPRQAHRDAKAAYELKATQTALQLMGHAGCRMNNEFKARYAYRRLRGQVRRDLENACLQRGIDLRE
ncbi:MAG: protein kinase [Myxococcota bacterium]